MEKQQNPEDLIDEERRKRWRETTEQAREMAAEAARMQTALRKIARKADAANLGEQMLARIAVEALRE